MQTPDGRGLWRGENRQFLESVFDCVLACLRGRGAGARRRILRRWRARGRGVRRASGRRRRGRRVERKARPGRRAIASYCASRSIARRCSKSQPTLFRFAATPIFSDSSPFAKFSANRRSDEEVLEVPRVNEGRDAPEGVVGRYSVGEFAKGLEPVDFGAAEGFDIDPSVRAGEDGADCDRDDVAELGAFRCAPFAGHRRLRSGRWWIWMRIASFQLRRLLSRVLTQF